MAESISTSRAPAAIGPYSQAVVAKGLVYCSGQISLKLDGTMLDGDIRAQTTQVLTNLQVVLEAAGSSLDKVVKTTVYLLNMADFSTMNEVYATFFVENKPARATVGVAALPKGALVEIDCVATVGD